MSSRERHYDDRQRTTPPGLPGPDDAAARARHTDTDRLLAQAADAIERALSGDSHQFLAANQQTGGQ